MKTVVQCVHCLTQMLWMILLRMMKKMEVGVLLGAVPKLGAEAPHREVAPQVEVPQLMIVPGIVQPVQAPKKDGEKVILTWAQPKKLEDKISSWKRPLSSFCMTQ